MEQQDRRFAPSEPLDPRHGRFYVERVASLGFKDADPWKTPAIDSGRGSCAPVAESCSRGLVAFSVPFTHPVRGRLLAAAVFTAAVALLAAGFSLHPSASGSGTHQQFGLPPCSLLMLTGYPCPTCGVTTAFAWGIRGEVGQALLAHPAGLALALVVVVSLVASSAALLTGRGWRLSTGRLPAAWLAALALGLVLGGWGFKLLAGLWTGLYPVGN